MNTKEKILQTAYELFIAKGYSEVKTRDIALKADVNLGLIPYYFGKKINLCVEVYDKMMKEIIIKIDDNTLKFDNPIEKYYYSYIMAQYYLLKNPDIYRFYLETLEYADTHLHPHIKTTSNLDEIIAFYDLNISKQQLEICFSLLFGAERSLITRKEKNILDINYFEINTNLIMIALNYIGLDSKLVKDHIDNVNKKVIDLPLDWKLFD